MFLKKNNKLCYLLACGPSIKRQNLSVLGDNPCVSISNFFVHDLYPKINVKYHIFGARHEPIKEPMFINWMNEASEKIHDSTSILVNDCDRALFCKNNLLPSHNLIFWSKLTTKDKYIFSILKKMSPIRFFNRLHDNLLVQRLPDFIFPCKGVAQIGLQICLHHAIKAGIDAIVLLGIDHSWGKHLGESRHFYEEDQHSLVRDGYNEWFKKPTQEEEKLNLKKIDELYLKYFLIAKSLGITIYNGSPSSMVKSLPTITI